MYRIAPENAEKIASSLQKFGFQTLGLQPSDFLTPSRIVQLGVSPHRIDLINVIDGLTFDRIWKNKMVGDLGGTQVYFISKEDLILNKQAAGRIKDLADAQILGSITD